MNRLGFIIEWYHKENERRSSLNNSLNIPIGILTGLFALFFFLTKEFSFKNDMDLWIKWSFIILTAISILFWLIAVFNLFKSYNRLFKGYEYKGIPYPTVLNEQYQKLEKFVEENKDDLEGNTTADTLYQSQLNKMLSEYLNRNIDNNDTKSRFLHVAKKYLFGCIIFVILSAIPFMLNYMNYKDNENTQLIKVENFNELDNKINNLEISNLKIGNYERKRKSTEKTDTTTTTSPTVD